MHSIISFLNEKGVTIDFHRLKQKQPKTVLQKVYKAFTENDIFLNSINNNKYFGKCVKVTIHYTDYEKTEGNKTFECTYDEFLKTLVTSRSTIKQ